MKSTRKWGVTQVLKEVIILKEITLKYLWYKRNVPTTFTGPQMYFSFSLKLVLRKDKLVGKLAWALIFFRSTIVRRPHILYGYSIIRGHKLTCTYSFWTPEGAMKIFSLQKKTLR